MPETESIFDVTLKAATIFTRDQIVDTIRSEINIQQSLSIEDISCNPVVGTTAEACLGRTELHADPISKLRKSGILPFSKELYDARAEKRGSKGLVTQLALPGKTLDDLKGYRIRVAYRLVRYMARIRGDLPGFCKLDSSLQGKWKVPHKLSPQDGYQIGTKGIRAMIHHWSNSSDTFTYHDGDSYKTVRGATYLPPEIPDRFYIEAGAQSVEEIWKMRQLRVIPEGYEPCKDMSLKFFCETMEMLAEKLDITSGTEIEPLAGMYGITGLLGDNSARIAWPTVDELCMYEDGLIMHVYDELIESTSIKNVEKEIMRQFGVEREEAMDLAKMAGEVGTLVYREDMEQTRQHSMARLGRIADKAEGFDIRVTLAAIKQANTLKGLNKLEDVGTDDDIKSFVTRAVDFNEGT